MTDAKIIEKIQKLLALAERAGSPEEAENATARATEMMVKYAIDEAVLQAKGEASDDVIVTKVFRVTGYAKAKVSLLHLVAEAMDMKLVMFSNDRSGWSTVTTMVTGWSSDMDMYSMLVASLQVQAEREAERAVTSYKNEGGYAHGRSFKQSFFMGFASEVGSRLRKQRRAMVTASEDYAPGAGLALVDRADRVQRFHEAANPNLKKANGPTARTYSGYNSGVAAGKRADIGNARIGGNKTAIN